MIDEILEEKNGIFTGDLVSSCIFEKLFSDSIIILLKWKRSLVFYAFTKYNHNSNLKNTEKRSRIKY